MKTIKDARTFDGLLDIKYGKLGEPKRDEFELKAKAFVVGEMIKEARKEAHMTQEELALKTGTKKSYISRLLKMAKLIFRFQHFSKYLKRVWEKSLD